MTATRSLPAAAVAPTQRSVRGWVRVPAVAAPVVLIGGWLVAAQLQTDPARAQWATISDLAAEYARDRVVMTAALLTTGACLVLVALGLTCAAVEGRAALAVCGVGICAVAAAPLPTYAAPHALAALVAFAALVSWPAAGARPGPASRLAPRAARRATGVGVVLLVVLYLLPGLLGGFGMVERLLAGSGTVWTCLVVLDCTRRRPVAPRPPAPSAPPTGPGRQ